MEVKYLAQGHTADENVADLRPNPGSLAPVTGTLTTMYNTSPTMSTNQLQKLKWQKLRCFN